MPAGDGVDDAEAGQPRRRGRIYDQADEGKPARERQCGADEREALRGAVTVGFRCVRTDEATCDFVESVDRESTGPLDAG